MQLAGRIFWAEAKGRGKGPDVGKAQGVRGLPCHSPCPILLKQRGDGNNRKKRLDGQNAARPWWP